MRLKVAGIGQRMPRWVEEGWREYAKRMPRELPLELQELPLAHRGKNPDLARLLRREGEALLAAAPADARIIAMDLSGQAWSTGQLARRLEDWMGDGRDCVFLIGGPDGLDQACLSAAELTWALGPLTLPHPLVRVLLAEQLYRAWTIIAGHPYHRA
jgi:23S rRNA (pseudouridine1915-N3)-methyltransferase